jgi:predicted Fe-Mo cluster-binding NifX family protein
MVVKKEEDFGIEIIHKIFTMIIAITSDGSDLDSSIAEKFTRAQFIIFYNKDEETFNTFRNPHSAVFGGAGIQTAQLIIENNANAVIARDIGLNAFRLLRSANVEVYPCSKLKVREVIREFELGRLTEVKREPKDYSKKNKDKLY